MQVPHIEMVPIDQIKPNPYRDLATYPWIEDKIANLMRSYKDVGFWAGLIARKTPDGDVEIPFGHHRVEAGKRLYIKELPMIIEELDDEQMIKMMARENSEDYGTDFLVQLNTWEGGIQYLRNSAARPENPRPLEIARLLGMTSPDDSGKYDDRLDRTAMACNNAHALIHAGHMNRDDLRGLTVTAVGELTQQVLSQMERVDRMAKMTKPPATTISKAKGYIAAAGRNTAKAVREGTLARKDIRTSVQSNAFERARKDKDIPTPLLVEFARALSNSLLKMLEEDAASEKLHQLVKALPQITMEEDFEAVRRIQFDLETIGRRAEIWHKRLMPSKEKVVALKAVEDRS